MIYFREGKTYTFKQFEDLNVRPETIKLLEENIGRTLFDITHNNVFLDLCPMAKEIETKINKWDLIKYKSFCRAKETRDKTKRQPMDWEKIFANDMGNKRLISKNKQTAHTTQYQTNKQTTQSKIRQKV